MNTGSKRRFAVFDIDGTLIRWQLYHAVVNQLIHLGAISPAKGEDIHQARMTWKRRENEDSFRSYEKVLVHAYHDAIQDMRVADFTAAIDAVFDEYKDQVYTYTRDMIKRLKAEGYVLLAISGSHQQIIDKLARHYGFDDAIGQDYEVKDGTFSGEHTRPMHHKDIVLQGLIDKHGLTTSGSIAVGDSESDIAMLAAVEQPIAFNPTRGLFAEATSRGWQIVVERKNVVYDLNQSGGGYMLNQGDTSGNA
jgi:HAD superfamily hydrolase (TIGR01490 family)